MKTTYFILTAVITGLFTALVSCSNEDLLVSDTGLDLKTRSQTAL